MCEKLFFSAERDSRDLNDSIYIYISIGETRGDEKCK